ncbi:MAG: 1-(5-phosphoribosyl)-5-[(5-phosphoribosylamino)methylideneamino]imidazole-4-carboxamide isomerase [Methanobacteriaceae archaeon]|nr:1-(5-phosphoribosyl)-5-[(5-phosphoribosylamino)methylideneamino]imidazole-4-carboxamide isomerase [Methanobacteriaceae archaeon]
MIVIPAVDLKNGKCVQLVQGKPGTEQIKLDNPAEVALDWEEKGAKKLHLVDLDGALQSGENRHIVKEIIENTNIPIQMGGGIRTLDNARTLLDAGVTNVIIGTMAIKDPETIQVLADEYGKESVTVALDGKDNKVVVHGWTKKTDKSPAEYAQYFEKKNAGSILYTNVDVEGLLTGINQKALDDVLENINIPLIYSGGITSLDDIKTISKTKTEAIVIGSALYKGYIKFEDTLKI